MSEVNSKRKAPLISLVIIFLLLILVTVFLLKELNATNVTTDSLNLLETNSTEYTASKKVEIDSYITSLNELYGINVIYGGNTINYANKVDATVETDLNIVNNNIKILFHTLEKYPKDMFKIFRNKEYKLDIVLLDRFTNNNIGLASKNNLKEVKLYICNTDQFERAIHHEMFHIFEYYVADRNRNVFNNWNELNPNDFKYDSNIYNLNNKYVYLKKDEVDLQKQKDSYFVTKYAKTSSKEDRAETFAEIMMLSKTPVYLQDGANIRKKADNILLNMGEYLNIKNIYCNKFLK